MIIILFIMNIPLIDSFELKNLTMEFCSKMNGNLQNPFSQSKNF